MLPDLHHWPLDRIRAHQDERLRHMLDLCARGHPYYRERWSKAGVDIGAIRGIDDLVQLPLTPKRDLMATPEAFRLHLPDLPLHERVVWEMVYTSGSTADPTPIYNTTHDYHAYLHQSKRVLAIAGVTADDVIANLFPLTAAPMGAFMRAAANAYAVGAKVFAALPGAPIGAFEVQRPLDEAVRLIERHRATVLWGVTSFVRRVLMRAIELEADFRSVRMCAVTGEASSDASRAEMRTCLRRLDAAGTMVFDRYGSTEAGAFAQCREDGEWHNPTPELQFHEVVDGTTGARRADGERGELAITHLDRRGTVVLRFLVGDVVGMAHGPCPHCGRNGDRIVGPVTRTGDLVKVKGMLVNPAVLLEAMKRIEGIDEYQVIVQRSDAGDPQSMDDLVVRVASARTDDAALAQIVIDAVRAAVQVRPRIERVAADAIYDPAVQAKAKRFIDRRQSIGGTRPADG